MIYWQTQAGRATLRVDPIVLSQHLVAKGGKPVTDLARKGFLIALETNRDPSLDMPRSGKAGLYGPQPTGFLDYKGYTEGPSDDWHLRSGRIPKLSRALAIPVALIINNSRRARQYEFGGSAGSRPTRPLLTAFNRLRSRPGVTGKRQGVKL